MKRKLLGLAAVVLIVLAGCGVDEDADGSNRFTGSVIPNEGVELGYVKNVLPDGKVIECVYGRNHGSISCNWEAHNAG